MAIRNKRHSGTWSVVEAKAHLDEVIDEVEAERPQTLVKHGDERAAIVPANEWVSRPFQKGTLLDFLQNSGLGDYELDITRSADTGRDMDP